jgi:DNA polymerase-4
VNPNLNRAKPMVMHIDLNSCFATVEQQARPRLRGRPVAIVNRRIENTMIITCSYEAKAKGVKLGMSVKEAKKLCPDLVWLESDPAKYKFVYHKLMAIMQDYSAHVRMKSIDEGVIDFSDSTGAMMGRDLAEIGYEIKQRLWDEVGCAMNCNVGISTNRFLAKTAASLHKPNGLDVITHDNLRAVLASLELTDLTGIAGRFERRLNAVGIFTPLQFLDADPVTLKTMVFKSVVGLEWHQRLRGWEVDKRDFPMRTAGRQYVLDGYKMPRAEVLKRLHHLCEETGSKVRSQGLVARGVSVHARSYSDTGRGWGGTYWHARHMAATPFFSNQAIFEHAKKLFESAPAFVKEIGVSCYELSEPDDSQLHLFGDELARDRAVTTALDEINARYGKRVLHSADTLTTKMMREKIPFGSTRYM